MLSIDMAFVDANRTELVAIAGRAKDSSSSALYGAVGECVPVFKKVIAGTEINVLSTNSTSVFAPGASATQIFLHQGKEDLYQSKELMDQADNAKTVMISSPRHGKISWLGDEAKASLNLGSDDAYLYEPNNGFLGRDRATFMVKFGEYRIKVEYYIHVTSKVMDVEKWNKIYSEICPRESWQISTPSQFKGSSTVGSVGDLQASQPNAD